MVWHIKHVVWFLMVQGILELVSGGLVVTALLMAAAFGTGARRSRIRDRTMGFTALGSSLVALPECARGVPRASRHPCAPPVSDSRRR